MHWDNSCNLHYSWWQQTQTSQPSAPPLIPTFWLLMESKHRLNWIHTINFNDIHYSVTLVVLELSHSFNTLCDKFFLISCFFVFTMEWLKDFKCGSLQNNEEQISRRVHSIQTQHHAIWGIKNTLRLEVFSLLNLQSLQIMKYSQFFYKIQYIIDS